MASRGGLFVRESSGLVKSANLMDAVSINVANMSIGAALGTVGFTLASLPTLTGVNLVYASIIAFLVSIPQLALYTLLIGYIPRTGGDYVWVSRFAGPRLAWLAVGLVFGFIIESLAYYALIAIAGVGQLESALSVMGINANLSMWGVIGVAIAFFAAIVAVNMVNTKYGIRLMTALTIVSTISLIASLAVLLATPRPLAVKLISSTLPKGVTYGSLASKYVGPYFALGPTLMMLPFFAIYIYPWLNAAPAISAEIRGRGALRLNLPIASVVTFTLATLSFYALYNALGFRFSTEALAQGYVNYWTAAMALARYGPLSWFIGIGSVLWYLAVLSYGAIVIVRYLFALSFDRVLPEFFSYIHPRLRTPIYAHAFDLAVTSILIILAESIYQTFQSLYGAVVEALIYFAFVGVVASAAAIRGRVLGMTSGIRAAVAASGLLTFGVMAYLTYQFLAYPAIWGGNPLAYGVEALAVIIGIAIYFASRRINMAKGLELEAVFAEIPPE